MRVIEEEWHVNFQLALPDIHCLNATERVIQTSKAHFIYVLAGVNSTFPKYLCGFLLDQTELIINSLHQATLDPSISAWAYFDVPNSYDVTPLGPLGCKYLIGNKTNARKSWDFCSRDGFNIGLAFHHYC